MPAKKQDLREPWLSPLSQSLINDVNGFLAFLNNRLQKYTLPDGKEASEIQYKIHQLNDWKQFAQSILDCPRPGYIDAFALFGAKFEIRALQYDRKDLKALCPLEQGVAYLENEEETKFSDCLQSRPMETDTSFPTGFILGQCLRRINHGLESREIFTAHKCTFEPNINKVLSISAEKYIVKRVGKVSNNVLNERLRREFKIQMLFSQLKHKNINQLVQYYENEEHIVSVSHSAGDSDLLQHLMDHLEANNKAFDEGYIKRIFKGVVEGILVAHNVGIAHRDISLENIVLNRYHKKERLEVIDWGHAIAVGLNEKLCVNPGPIGKPRYMAPELVYHTGRKYDPFAADVFALGVCLFSVIFGHMPFGDLSDGRGQLLRKSPLELLASAKAKSSIPNFVSKQAMDLLDQCLRWNPSERITVANIYKHEFFS